jgi:excisionase family DNA binding protein
MNKTNSIALSIPEAVSITGIGRTTLYAAIKAGKLVAQKCGKRTIILQSDLINWLNSLSSSVMTSDSGGGNGYPQSKEDGHGQA